MGKRKKNNEHNGIQTTPKKSKLQAEDTTPPLTNDSINQPALPAQPPRSGTILGAPTPSPSSSSSSSSLSSSTPAASASAPSSPSNPPGTVFGGPGSLVVSPLTSLQPLIETISLNTSNKRKTNKAKSKNKKRAKNKQITGHNVSVESVDNTKQENNNAYEETKNEEPDSTDGSQAKENLNKKCTITRYLIGSYTWADKHKIYTPGYPDLLKPNFLSCRASNLGRGLSKPEVGHPNEFLHDIYFEPVQVLLEQAAKDLSTFDILTDRGNLQKIDSALTSSIENASFIISLCKYNNLLMVKREDPGTGFLIGHQFEKALCVNTPFLSSHILVHTEIKVPSGKTINMLIRGEIDACEPDLNIPRKKDYNLQKKTASNLEVYTTIPLNSLYLKNLREIKMAAELYPAHHFQSWLLGVKKIVHGVKARKVTRTKELGDFNVRFKNATEYLLSFLDKMDSDCIYTLERKNCAPLEFKKSDQQKKWLQT